MIIYSLILLMTVSAVSIGYFNLKRTSIQQRLITNLTQEVQKKYPKIGYTFSVTSHGEILTHPLLHEFNEKKIESLFEASQKDRILSSLTNLKDQQSILLKNSKDHLGHSINLFFLKKEKVIFGLLFFPNELTKFVATNERHILILISLLMLCMFCCLLLLAAIFFLATPEQWWFIVLLVSCGMLVEIGYLWSLHNSIGFRENLETIPLLSKAQETNFFQKIESENSKKYIVIPTGIFIENAQFTLQTSEIFPGIFLTGYIWQRYSVNNHEDIDRECIITNAYQNKFKKIYHEISGDEEKICWAFSCNLYQVFNPRLYPFDHRHIVLNMLHKNFYKNVVLAPDLQSYETLNPILLPGLSSQSIMPSHWNVIKSFFNYKIFDFKTTLGLSSFSNQETPYLQFIINTQRKLGGNFIMDFMVLIVVLIILFILLMAFLQETTISVLTACSALLFVLITSEINLRQTLKTEGIVYLEFLYFICYFIIIGVIINNILLTKKSNLNIITYRNNLIFKMLYWPLLLLSIVIVTATMFY